MVRELTVRQVGGSIGATIPKDMTERLHLAAGDRVLAVETDRGILLPRTTRTQVLLQTTTPSKSPSLHTLVEQSTLCSRPHSAAPTNPRGGYAVHRRLKQS